MKKRLYMNQIVSLLYQLCAVIAGLILSRLILNQFGSEANGVATSITQFLSVISMLDLGVGAVVQSALYKPLVDKDSKRISEIYSDAKRYFSTIARVLILYAVVLCIYYGIFKSDVYSWIYTSTLILAISINYFAQYYFGIVNILLLNADQRIYVVSVVNLAITVLNAIAIVVAIRIGASIQLVKLVSAGVFLLRPVFWHIYVKKNYCIDVLRNPPNDAIQNKWSGVAQHITKVITNSIDNVLLTIFGTFTMVSVYNVYILPLIAIRNIVEVTSNSYMSYFGNIIAKDDRDLLSIEFNKYETLMHYITSIIMSTVLVTLIPFVLIYTAGVGDANYKDDIFGLTITLAYVMFILRVIYTNIIFAAGKFKETQTYCIVECILNVVISLVLVKPLGLTGVAIGTVVSSGYRMIVSAYYLKKDILFRSMKRFFVHLLVDVLCFSAVKCFAFFLKWNITSFISWTIYAAIVFFVSFLFCSIINLVAYRKEIISVVNSFVRRIRR